MAVTPADVAATLGRSTPASSSPEFAQWTLWISDARRLIELRLGDLDELNQDVLDYVVREAVAARVRRPEATTSSTVAIDDGTVTKRWEQGSGGQIIILPDWWDLLRPATDAKAFSTRPGFDPDRPDWCWPWWSPC